MVRDSFAILTNMGNSAHHNPEKRKSEKFQMGMDFNFSRSFSDRRRVVSTRYQTIDPYRFLDRIDRDRHRTSNFVTAKKEKQEKKKMKIFLLLFTILAIVDAVRSYENRYFCLAACDGVILLILLIAFLVSRNKKRSKP